MLVLACACSDDFVSPDFRPEPARLATEYECIVDLEAGTTDCHPAPATEGGTGPQLDLLLGAGPLTVSGSWVHSRGSTADEDTSIATVRFINNMAQPIGTTDGVNAHANGNRLFFTTVPYVISVSSGTVAGASVQLVTPDGTASFSDPGGTTTFANRPYYQFNGVVVSGDTSASREIRYIYSSNVTGFSYRFRIATPVQYEYGWVTITPSAVPVLEPGATTTLAGTAYDAYGVMLSDGMSWYASDPSVLSVHPTTGQVTAVGEGTATITATSTVDVRRTGTRVVAVDRAPAVAGTTPANGGMMDVMDNIVVTLSEAVSVSASSFSLGCITGPQPVSVSGSGTGTITVHPINPPPSGDTCTLTVVAAHVSDADPYDGPNLMVANHVFSFEVTGFGGF